MKGTPLAAGDALALLRENLSRLSALIAGRSSAELHTARQPEEWSANDVLAHLRACGDVWGGNIAKILANEHPLIAGINPRTWMKRTEYPLCRFDEAFAAFSTQRQLLLDTLAALTPGDWERTASVTAYGQSNERTLRSYASQLANHEQTHIRQVERILGLPSPVSSLETPP